MLHPQCFGHLRAYESGSWMPQADDDIVVGTCALGAALLADGHLDVFAITPAVPCPACGVVGERGISQIVGHLNDQHRWTREAIADWVATVEPADERSASPEAADAVGQRSEEPHLTTRA